MRLKRLLVGFAALGLGALALVRVGATTPSVHAQQQAPFLIPHGNYSGLTELCAVCHDWHDNTYDNTLLVQPTEPEACYLCHDGSGSSTNIEADFAAPTRASAHPVLAPQDGAQVMCSDCHAEHQSPDDSMKLLYRQMTEEAFILSPPDNPIGDTFCYGCHGSASTLPAPLGDKGLFETSIHATSDGVRPPTPGTDLKCSACHEPHASDFAYLTRADEEELCFTCHASAEPNTANGSNPEDAFTVVANDYTPGSVRIYHHPVADAEQAGGTRVVECASCHNSHLVNRTETASDPARARAMDSGWRFEWDTPGSYNRGSNVTAFCGTCHIDASETAPLSASADVPYDVRLVEDVAHDVFTLSRYSSSAHGAPDAGNLACTACHDFHGSSNAFMLRENVASPDYGPLPIVGASWEPPAEGRTDGTATLTLADAGLLEPGFFVQVSGVYPPDYDGLYKITGTTATTISYSLTAPADPGPGTGGQADPRGVGDGRPYSATVTGFNATGATVSALQAFCLTCHLEQSPTHEPDQLCTECHNHGVGADF